MVCMTKTCTVCNTPIGSLTQTGLCKKCYDKKYREDHGQDIEAKAKANARTKQWQKDNPERANAKSKKWRDDNPEKEKARHKKYREENAEKVKAQSKKWREENPEKMKAARDKYREENPDNTKKTKRFTIIEIDGVQFNTQVRVNTKTGHVGTDVESVYKERAANRTTQWCKNNPEQHKAAGEQWCKNNPDKVAVINKRWQKNNPDHSEQYRREHKEEIKARDKQYRKNNPEKVREHQRERRIYLSAYTDCEKVNHAFMGCDAHHIDPDTIIHIPTSLHRSVSHSLKSGHGMEEINQMSFDWLNGVRRESPQTSFAAFV